jgi:hypothetical protein
MQQRASAMFWAPVVILILLGMPPKVTAAPVNTIWYTGDPNNRVDIAVVGDGYTAGELGAYAAHVNQLIGAIGAQQPFHEYAYYFNVHRVDLTSPESGADHPEYGSYRNTALGASYDCYRIPQLLCVDVNAVMTVLGQSLPPAMRDLVIVLVNDPTYGGSGGAVAVTSRHSAMGETMLHELGHSLGLLADEYGGPPPPDCELVEPPEPNVSYSYLKWWDWIAPGTPVPTPPQVASLPGLYDGAKYCDHGLYRPTPNSKMRQLGLPYDAINQEQLIKRIYTYTDPIDAWSPAGSSVTIDRGQPLTFAVTTTTPVSHELNVWWYLNSQWVASGTPSPSAAGLAPGTYTVDVLVYDPTPMVRTDPNHLLWGGHSWTLTVR